MKTAIKDQLKPLLLILISAFLSAFAYQAFARQGSLYPAGFMGLSVLLSQLGSDYLSLSINFNFIYIILNMLATLLVMRVAGKRFLLLSILQYLLTTLFIALLPETFIVDDILLLALFGGAIAGLSCILALKAGASSGGSDFLAIYFSSRKNSPAWYGILCFNWMVLGIAGLNFGMREAMYSMLYQTVAIGIINYMHNRYKLVNIYIITSHEKEIISGIFRITDHGITKLKAEGGYTRNEKNMLYMVVNEYEIDDIVAFIKNTDPEAFISTAKAERVFGNFLQQKLN